MDTPTDEKQPSDVRHSLKVSAEILFGVSLVFMLSIFLFNFSLMEKRVLRAKKVRREINLSEMLGRLQSYREKNEVFFKSFVSSGLDSYCFLEFPRKVIKKPDLWENKKFCDELGKEAISILASYSEPDDRLREFKALIAEVFAENPEYVEYLNRVVSPVLAKIDTPESFEDIAFWVAFENRSNGPFIRGPDVSITFGKQFYDRQKSDERSHIYQLMMTFSKQSSSLSKQSSVDEELFNLWKQAYEEKRASTEPFPGVSFFGLSISADSVVFGIAPILTVLQLIFLIYWEKRHTYLSNNKVVFTFPNFACPNDPLAGSRPHTLGEAAQRFLWLLFLILPVCLLAIGLLTRYDLSYLLLDDSNYFFSGLSDTLFETQNHDRSRDWLSFFWDWVIFACLILSMLTVSQITKSKSKKKPRSKAAIRVVNAAAFICGTVFIILSYRSFEKQIGLTNMLYLVAFGCLCAVFFAVGFRRRSRLLMFLSAVGAALFLIHFIPLATLIER